MLTNGKWSKEWDPYQAINKKGEFVRQTSEFRHWITPDGSTGRTGVAGFKAEPGRYHLYVSLVCPWACRTLMVRVLKGLEAMVSVSVVEPFLTEQGWKFGDFPGATDEPFFGLEYLHELYSRVEPSYTGRATVPVLWDKERNMIVNNESADIIEMFNSAFNHLGAKPLNLRPANKIQELVALNEKIYHGFNNGVYKAGFAQTQEAYEEAYHLVFATLDDMENRLTHSRYLLGDTLTEADIRLFVTLVRFDAAYYGLFKCNKKRIADYPQLTRFIEDIIAMKGINRTVNLEHIKNGYYSVKALNPTGIVPLGPENNRWQSSPLTLSTLAG